MWSSDLGLISACYGRDFEQSGYMPALGILWGFATSCFALALTGLMPADRFNIAAVCWLISGMSFILGDAPMTALLQGTIPNHLQGRGLSLLNMVMGLAAPLGLALTTPLRKV
ncbi:hypothetical protein ALP58_200098 [Pseudomonas savastanoi]|uniref:Uncharacterized protein n=1 Tax=Pseudomonas savastanoi TaxID=29438 RepID=A0A3M5H8D9_PSESS|nr:hypothetical protein ALP58_200098 [Pseudomonas savastanoi]